jgi:hypothetical protein
MLLTTAKPLTAVSVIDGQMLFILYHVAALSRKNMEPDE